MLSAVLRSTLGRKWTHSPIVQTVFGVMLCLTALTSLASERLLSVGHYDAKYRGSNIKMERKLFELGQGRFKLSAKAKNFWGSIKEEEVFEWSSEAGIRPVSYFYRQKILGLTRKRSIDFDWSRHTALANYKKIDSELALEKGMLGPMTYQLQMQLDLLSDKIKKKSGGESPSFRYAFVNKNRIKKYVFDVASRSDTIAHKKLSVDDAVKLKRSNEKPGRSTFIWFDPAENYTMAALKQVRSDGENTLFLLDQRYFPPMDNTPYQALVNL